MNILVLCQAMAKIGYIINSYIVDVPVLFDNVSQFFNFSCFKGQVLQKGVLDLARSRVQLNLMLNYLLLELLLVNTQSRMNQQDKLKITHFVLLSMPLIELIVTK